MEGDLETTNLLLGIMAGVGVLQTLLLIGAGITGFRLYRRVSALASTVEAQHVGPTMVRVNALLEQTSTGVRHVLDNVKGVTSTLKEGTDRVDHTVKRVQGNMRATTVRVAALVHGLRVMVERLRSTGPRNEPRAVEGFR